MTVRLRDTAQRAAPPQPRRPAGAPLWSLTVAAAALTAAAFVPRLWVAGLASAFRPHYAVVGAACLAAMALTRRWRGAALAAGVVAANAAVLAPLWLHTPPPATPGAPTLTVLWHNVYDVGADRGDDLVEAVVAADADVVLLAQVEPGLAQALRDSDDLPHEVVHDADGRILVLARVPVAGARAVGALPGGSRDSLAELEAEVTPNRSVALLGLRTQSPRTPRRAGVRDGELAVAGRWAAARNGPAVVVGDLNTTPWSRPFRDLARAGGLRDSLRGRGLQPTWPAGWGLASVPIDHALHSPELTVVDRATGPPLGSRHRSLRVTFAVE